MNSQSQPDLEAVRAYFMALQNRLCAGLEEFEPSAKFAEDAWQHSQTQSHWGGGGITRSIADGAVFEKGGVNFSQVRGANLPTSASATRPHLAGKEFVATGVSAVLHPRNPYVPCCHFNARFFVSGGGDAASWWFGGGFDLTPYYGFAADCVHWHRTAKRACDPFGAHLYPKFKAWCDEYFYLKHRGEARGIGGLFFDDYAEDGFAQSFAFVQRVGDSFLDAYAPLVARRRDTPYGESEKQFQCYRRGRYVEFNLVYDRGTLFGLESGGRVESILMSLPPQVHWRYDWQPDPGSVEAQLASQFLTPRDWLAHQ